MRPAWASLAICLASASAARGDGPLLALPIDCTLGQTCFIQQYVDHKDGPEAVDYHCGPLTYDGHKGTDFAVASVRDAIAGVRALASASGRVTAVRDGEADHFDAPDDTGTPGRDCGNGVVIDHGGGWETQYCHLMNGSIRVAVGDDIPSGRMIGLVGMSGRAAFPHVHLSVRHDGRVIDPFASDTPQTCGEAGSSLWSDEITYQPGGLVSAGFAPDLPDFATIRLGEASHGDLPHDAPALVFWVQLFGTREGDVLDLVITGPKGLFSRQSFTLDRQQARAYRASGRKLKKPGEISGTFSGEAQLVRDGKVIDRITATVEVLP